MEHRGRVEGLQAVSGTRKLPRQESERADSGLHDGFYRAHYANFGEKVHRVWIDGWTVQGSGSAGKNADLVGKNTPAALQSYGHADRREGDGDGGPKELLSEKELLTFFNTLILSAGNLGMRA